ncbi:MAG: Rho GTPase-activating protein [Simkaniaceae bacterium]|nr:Rho GTPase-activating protein [Candidatus Sacchlamyda saccharinae]
MAASSGIQTNFSVASACRPGTEGLSLDIFYSQYSVLAGRISTSDDIERKYPKFKQELDELNKFANYGLSSIPKIEVEAVHAEILKQSRLVEGELVKTKTGQLDLLANAIIEKKSTEGLFRVGGSASVKEILLRKLSAKNDGLVQTVGAAFNKLFGETRNIFEEVERSDIHAVAGAFKELLREQNPSLLDTIKAELLVEGLDLQTLKPLIQKLGDSEKAQLKIVLDLCSEIASTDGNKMDASNLAICIAPNLFTPAEDLAGSLHETRLITPAVQMMIENASELFE